MKAAKKKRVVITRKINVNTWEDLRQSGHLNSQIRGQKNHSKRSGKKIIKISGNYIEIASKYLSVPRGF